MALWDWSEKEQKAVKDLIKEFAFLFTLDDLDVGKTFMVKYTDPTPFRERYWWILPQQFEEVKEHLQEMLEIGANHKSSSPQASMVVLVQKKDGSMSFCIDLHKLNACIVKDVYLIPQKDESLDYLKDAKIFGSCDWVLAGGPDWS